MDFKGIECFNLGVVYSGIILAIGREVSLSLVIIALKCSDKKD